MQLQPGKAEEYTRRHDELWPELEDILKVHGVSSYSIHFDERTHVLFAVQMIEDEEKLKLLPQHPIMRKWWDYMSDIMETNEDNSPVLWPLKNVFELKKDR